MCSSGVSPVKNLKDLTEGEIKEFLDSFDYVLSDCDGVVWFYGGKLPGSTESLTKLQKLGKKIYFVSNNSIHGTENYVSKLEKLGFSTDKDHIIIPSRVILWYLKRIDFKDEAFVISSQMFRRELIAGGIKVIEPGPDCVPEGSDIWKYFEDRPSVKAVIYDFDANCNWIKLNQALFYIRREDVTYFVGATDESIILKENYRFLGPGLASNMLVTETGKVPVYCAKPSKVLEDYVREECKIKDPSRVLFIGDSFETDMAFAQQCGFQKLFVGSGADSIDNPPKDYLNVQVDYYLPALADLASLIPK